MAFVASVIVGYLAAGQLGGGQGDAGPSTTGSSPATEATKAPKPDARELVLARGGSPSWWPAPEVALDPCAEAFGIDSGDRAEGIVFGPVLNRATCLSPGATERVGAAIAALAARGQTPILRGVSVATADDRARLRAAAQALLDAAPDGRIVDPRRALLIAPAARGLGAEALTDLRSGATRAAIRRALPDGVYPVLVVDVDAVRISEAALDAEAPTTGGAPTPEACQAGTGTADLEACAVLTGGATFLLEGAGTPVDLAARLTATDRLSAATARAVARARRAERAIAAVR